MPRGAEHECGRAVWVEEIDRLTAERNRLRALLREAIDDLIAIKTVAEKDVAHLGAVLREVEWQREVSGRDADISRLRALLRRCETETEPVAGLPMDLRIAIGEALEGRDA